MFRPLYGHAATGRQLARENEVYRVPDHRAGGSAAAGPEATLVSSTRTCGLLCASRLGPRAWVLRSFRWRSGAREPRTVLLTLFAATAKRIDFAAAPP